LSVSSGAPSRPNPTHTDRAPHTPDDPRAATVLDSPFISEFHGTDKLRAVLVHSTRRSRLRVGAGMDHIIEGPDGLTTDISTHANLARLTITTPLQQGQTLRIIKCLGYGWSGQRSPPAIEAQIEAALTAAKAAGWEGLLQAQRDYLDDFWSRADVEIDGDDEVQQATRFGLFHVLQA